MMSVQRLLRYIIGKSITISTAESCTGGLIAKKITDISGASQVFSLGLVTYSNEAKSKLLNIDEKIIKKHTAVSREVATLMAENVRKLSDSNIGLSSTGYADGEFGGWVFVAASCGKAIRVKELRLTGDRCAVREQAANIALELALSLAEENIK